MKNNRSHSHFHSIDSLFVVILFAVFIFMALLIISSGAAAYKNSAAQMDDRFDRQTCVSYISAKIRANNEADKISIVDFNGVNALCISENFTEGTYYTYIYLYDGMIRELFCDAELSLDLDAGSALTRASELNFSYSDGLYEITLIDDNKKSTVFYVNSL